MPTLPPSRKLLNDIVQWDVVTWSRAVNFWEHQVDWTNVHTCLELGGREGGLSLWLALKNKVVVCSDLSNVEVTAKALHEQYNVSRMIVYEDIDATDIPYENHFDLVVFKSILGGIGRNNDKEKQQEVFDQIYKALVPGGYLLFAENLKASMLHQRLRKRFNKWSSYWRYPSYNELQVFLKDFSSHSIKTTGLVALFGRNEKHRDLLASLDAGLDTLVNKHWKYMAYGIAVK